MSKELALPSDTISADQRSAQALQSSCGKCEVTEDEDGEWNITLSPDCTSDDLARGIHALTEELRGGPGEAIAASLMELISVTSRPPSMDDAMAAAYMTAMPKAMWDYPIDVVRMACTNWRRVPSHGKWWPTEQDLRAQCEKLFDGRRRLIGRAHSLLHALEFRERSAVNTAETVASPFAGRAQREFRAAMERRMHPHMFYAYFDADHVLFLGEDQIVTNSETAARVLQQEGENVAKRLGVKISYAPDIFVHLNPSPRQDTPEEKALTAEKFALLTEALRCGADISKMRREGRL